MKRYTSLATCAQRGLHSIKDANVGVKWSAVRCEHVEISVMQNVYMEWYYASVCCFGLLHVWLIIFRCMPCLRTLPVTAVLSNCSASGKMSDRAQNAAGDDFLLGSCY